MYPETWEELTYSMREFIAEELAAGDAIENSDNAEELKAQLLDSLHENTVNSLSDMEMLSLVSFVVLDYEERSRHLPGIALDELKRPIDVLLAVESAVIGEILPECLFAHVKANVSKRIFTLAESF